MKCNEQTCNNIVTLPHKIHVKQKKPDKNMNNMRSMQVQNEEIFNYSVLFKKREQVQSGSVIIRNISLNKDFILNLIAISASPRNVVLTSLFGITWPALVK